jgi:hypothetical protein
MPIRGPQPVAWPIVATLGLVSVNEERTSAVVTSSPAMTQPPNGRSVTGAQQKGDGLRLAVDVMASIDPFEASTHSAPSHTQSPGDLFVGQAAGRQVDDQDLARRQDFRIRILRPTDSSLAFPWNQADTTKIGERHWAESFVHHGP